MNVDLSIIIPTLNERENIVPLLEKLNNALNEVSWEVVFVDDDSKDHTSDIIAEISRTNERIHLVRRVGKKGLSSACIEGLSRCQADYIAVMDADLQHDETLLRKMLAKMKKESFVIVIGSRYVANAKFGSWSKMRSIMSRCATVFVRLFLPKDIQDPLSGFFMVTRDYFTRTADTLSGKGQKILLDLLLSSPESIRLIELPYQFRQRVSGRSKLSFRVIWENMLILFKRSAITQI